VEMVAIERMTVWFIAKIAARPETAAAGSPLTPGWSLLPAY
jgi:hypothetical protein